MAAAAATAMLLLFLVLAAACAVDIISVDVDVDGGAAVAEVEARTFVCATLDWWPPDKCDYGSCSWGNASLLNLDLSSTLLQNAIKAFSPLKIRLGGTLQDNVVYDVGKKGTPCLPFVKNSSHEFGFSGGCLPMERWDELNRFFRNVGSEVAFGLNALYGRTGPAHSQGPWDPTNAMDFIRYTHDKGYPISAWELGNELSGSGVGTALPPQQYARDMLVLRKMVDEVYKKDGIDDVPLVVAPDGFFDETWTNEFLQTTTTNASSTTAAVIDVLTHHIYNLGAGVDGNLLQKILDPSYLDKEATTFSLVKNVLAQHGNSIKPWVGESGGAYNSGHHLVTNAFVMGFWYIDQLGMSATFGTKSYCRQSLIGGNYGLLNTTTFTPNPDYYGALLWHRLMGDKVLKTNVVGSSFLRAYAHCSKKNDGITIVLLNLSNQTTWQVDLSRQPTLASFKGVRMEYHLAPKDGDLHSQTSLLNGVSLRVNGDEIPLLLPQIVPNEQPILVNPSTYAFISLPVKLPACS